MFDSTATNFVASDRNGVQADIFVRDRVAHTTTIVSVNSAGVQGIGFARFPSISMDGRFVAFDAADDLTPDNYSGVFVHDLVTGVTEDGNVDSAGQVVGGAGGVGSILSADGRFVAFYSNAPAVDPDFVDTNGQYDIFVHDRLLDTTRVVSTAQFWDNATQSYTHPANGPSTYPSISADGKSVAFESLASNLASGLDQDTNQVKDVFAFDEADGIQECGSSGFPECNGFCLEGGTECTAVVLRSGVSTCACMPNLLHRSCGISPFPMCDPSAVCPSVDADGVLDPNGTPMRCVAGPTSCYCQDPSISPDGLPPSPTTTTTLTSPTSTTQVAATSTTLTPVTTTTSSTLTPAPARAMLSCPAQVTPGQQFTVDVVIDVGTRPLGSYSVTLTYNTSVTSVAAVSGGTTPEFSATPATNLGYGSTSIAASQAIRIDGTAGIVDVARVTFNAISPSLGPSIGLAANSIYDTASNQLAATASGCAIGLTPATTSSSTTTLPTTTSTTSTTVSTTTTTSTRPPTTTTTSTTRPTTTSTTTTTRPTTTILATTTTTLRKTTSTTTTTLRR